MADDVKTIVLKFGGSAFQPEALRPFAERVRTYVAARQRVIVVHGGGKEVNAMLQALNLQSVFIEGLRVTDEATLKVVEMVLCGQVNKALVRALLSVGVRAVGISGQDGGLLISRPLVAERTEASGRRVKIDYGRVGEVEQVKPEPLEALLRSHIVPVVAPLGITSKGEALNLNADAAAAAIAGAMRADLFALLTDVPGVLVPQGPGTAVAPLLTKNEVARLKASGVVTGGMIPKVDCCLAALRGGAKASLIASMEAFTTGTELQGTRIVESAP